MADCLRKLRMKVSVLGSKGMLGHVVAAVLKQAGYQVATPALRYIPADREPFLQAIFAGAPDAIVNCIGARPNPTVSEDHLWAINAELPSLISAATAGRCRLVHASSDGVFRPDKPDRDSEEQGDADDAYGRSKWAGEEAIRASGGVVIRCSIIGPELGNPKSLFGWLLRQVYPVEGYTNQMWNGVTTLAWAEICRYALASGPSSAAVIQPASLPAVTKCELLRLVRDIWSVPVEIVPTLSPRPVTRTLRPNIQARELAADLHSLHTWLIGRACGQL
jgi:dTDP-4-dehydrorhamnose reductase